MTELVFLCYFSPTRNQRIPAESEDDFCNRIENRSEFVVTDGVITFKYKQAQGGEVYELMISGWETIRAGKKVEVYSRSPCCKFDDTKFYDLVAYCTVTLPPGSILPKNGFLTSFVEYCKNDPDMLITFKVGRQEIKAVTNIMMFKSPVIGAMMRMGCVESKTRVVKIEDFSFEVMQKFVEFCETDYVKVTDGYEMDLCKIADKYDVEPLKKLAGTLVADSIGRMNVLELFHFAKGCSNNELQAECIRFGRKNWTDIHEATVIENVPLDVLRDFWLVTRR